MKYAYVKDGKIVEGPKSLPKVWGNTSGFNLMSDAELAKIGWLPWRFVEISSPGDDWTLTSSVVEIKPTEIVETQAYRLITQSEKDDKIRQQREDNKEARNRAFREESDPLFFKAERGEATREEWLAKIEEIRGRYPT
jgi:hypothetical protein